MVVGADDGGDVLMGIGKVCIFNFVSQVRHFVIMVVVILIIIQPSNVTNYDMVNFYPFIPTILIFSSSLSQNILM